METPKLNTLKKELQQLSAPELVTHLTRIAKFKTENKELLNFLLFYQENTDDYANEIKNIIKESFEELNYSDYTKIKQIRKLVRIINKHLKFMADKKQEAELLLFFCNQFIDKNIYRTKLKALNTIFIRQFSRISKCIDKLESDFQFDYNRELENLIDKIRAKKIQIEQ